MTTDEMQKDAEKLIEEFSLAYRRLESEGKLEKYKNLVWAGNSEVLRSIANGEHLNNL